MSRTDLIPIIYIGGTGGSFLSFVLDSTAIGTAKNFKPKFTPNGSAHLMPRFTTMIPMQVDLPVDYQIDAVINYQNIGYDPDIPIFACFHMSIIREIMAHVERAILITYETEDIPDILSAFLAKRWIDGLYNNDGTRFDSVVDENDIDGLAKRYKEHLRLLVDYQHKFTPCVDYNNRILNLSWKEIIDYDPMILINKLSEFTGYETDRFDTDVIYEWQCRTRDCITHMSPTMDIIRKQHE